MSRRNTRAQVGVAELWDHGLADKVCKHYYLLGIFPIIKHEPAPTVASDACFWSRRVEPCSTVVPRESLAIVAKSCM